MSIDAFVNSNAFNVQFTVDIEDEFDMLYETLPTRFGAMVQHDAVDDSADPVLVYMLNGKPVGWYDMENAHGYVA